MKYIGVKIIEAESMSEDVASIRESIAVLNETFKAFSQVIPESECKKIVDKIFELVEKL